MLLPCQGLSVLLCWLSCSQAGKKKLSLQRKTAAKSDLQCIVYLLSVFPGEARKDPPAFLHLSWPFLIITKKLDKSSSAFDMNHHPWRTAKGGCSREEARSHKFQFRLWSSPFSCLCDTPSIDMVHPALKTGLGSSLFCSHETSLQRETWKTPWMQHRVDYQGTE